MLEPEMNKKVVDELKDQLTYITYYFQGEPYLNKDFTKMVSYASENNIYTATSSNAHYLNDENCIATINSGLSRLIISIDGVDQESYGKYRIGGKLDKVIEGTKNLLEWREKMKSKTPYVIWQFIVFRHNENEIDDIKALAKEIGVDKLALKTAQVYNFESGKDNSIESLISCSVSLNNSSWYNQEVVPILYDYFPGSIPIEYEVYGGQSADMSITRRPISLGVPPTSAVFLDYSASTGEGVFVPEGAYNLGYVPEINEGTQYIKNDVLLIIYEDFLDYDQQLRDIILSNFMPDLEHGAPTNIDYFDNLEWPPGEPWTTFRNHVETPPAQIFPGMPVDTYPVTFTYKLPGTNTPTTIYTIQLGNE